MVASRDIRTLVLVAAAIGLHSSVASAVRAPVTLRASSGDEVILGIGPVHVEGTMTPRGIRLHADGFGTQEDPGQYEIPRRSVLVAVPPSTVPRLVVLSEQWSEEAVGELSVAPRRKAVRSSWEPATVESTDEPARRVDREVGAAFSMGTTAGLRDRTVVPVLITPVQYDEASRRYRTLVSATIEIRFVASGGSAHSAGVHAVAGRASTEGREWAMAPINGTKVGEGAATVTGIPSEAPWGGGAIWRLSVHETGMTAVRAEDLLSRGLPPATSVASLRVYQRRFRADLVDSVSIPTGALFEEVPVPAVVNDDGDGVFEPGETLWFYARSFRDQWMTSGWEHEDTYDQTNEYWMTVRIDGGSRLTSSRPLGSLTGVPGDTLAATTATSAVEQDLRYYTTPPDFGLGEEGFETEFYYYNDMTSRVDPANGYRMLDTFKLPSAVLSQPGSLRVRVVGGGKPTHTAFTNRLQYYLNGSLIGEHTFYNADRFTTGGVADPAAQWTDWIVPSGILKGGSNELEIRGWTYRGRSTVDLYPVTRFFVDRAELTYHEALRADGDVLTVTVPPQDVWTVATVSGFTTPDIELFDVTNPGGPESWTVASSQVAPAGDGTYAVTFDVPPSDAGRTCLVLGAQGVAPLSASDIHSTKTSMPVLAAGVRHLIVSHESLATEASRLADHRRLEMSAGSVTAREAYDVFNNGHKDPVAIRNLCQYLFFRTTERLEYVCLLGDASEDPRSVTGKGGPDLVPTHGLWGAFEGTFEGSDQYYATLTETRGVVDDLPDVSVGRIPANDSNEARTSVDRVIWYEEHAQEEGWRRVVILQSDDLLSGSLGAGFGSPYQLNRDSDETFARRTAAYVDALDNHPFDDFAVEPFYLNQWTHPCDDSCYVASPCEEPCGFLEACGAGGSLVQCMLGSVRDIVTPELLSTLSGGALLWNYEGHSNRFWLGHEQVFADFPGLRRDVAALRNDGRPFVFAGFGCLLGEFESFDESVYGGCLSEKMMNLPDAGKGPRGAVGAFASSGFELIPPNGEFNDALMDALFFPSGEPDGGLGAPAYEWRLGDAATLARLEFQELYPTSGAIRLSADRFVLFGDPALKLDSGRPRMSVSVNGEVVVDGEFLDLENGDALELVADVSDGRGVRDLRAMDSEQGRIEDGVEVNPTDVDSNGVVRSAELRLVTVVREGNYDIAVVATDANGRESRLSVSLRDQFEVVQLAAYPSPFAGKTDFVYTLTERPDAVEITVYTVNGRRIWSGRGRLQGDQGSVQWDGNDGNGRAVANGTYLVLLRAWRGARSERAITHVVRMQ